MRISIRRPLGYSQIGRKDRQEDAVWPSFDDVTTNNRCIVLCDGVGGSEHGEIASQTVSKVIGEYLTEMIAKTDCISEQNVQDAVNLAYDELERIDTKESEDGAVSMATTLTCVCLHSEGVLTAHMGDSRIYHIRPGQGVLYESRDHSLVRALLDAGELNEEEAKNFPRKNVITKALQPHGQKRFGAEVRQLTDVQSGDYLFLCCDGVLEQLTVGNLFKILSMPCSDKEKIALLETESTGKTKDNYTAYLIPIDSVEGASSLSNDEDEISADIEDAVSIEHSPKPLPPTIKKVSHTPPVAQTENKQKKPKHSSPFVSILIVCIGLILIVAAYIQFTGRTETICDTIKSVVLTDSTDTLHNNK